MADRFRSPQRASCRRRRADGHRGRGGVIAAIAPRIVCDAPAHDAEGRFVCGGLVETHIHLDKAGIIGPLRDLRRHARGSRRARPRRPRPPSPRRTSTPAPAAVLEKAVLTGTTRMRTFVEIDPRAGFRSFEAIKRLKADYADLIDIEICAFAQEGLTQRARDRGDDRRGACAPAPTASAAAPTPTRSRPSTSAASSTSPSASASRSISISISTSTPPAPTCRR